jgi:putative ATP-binding cassette transporter
MLLKRYVSTLEKNIDMPVAFSYVQRDFCTTSSNEDVASFKVSIWKFISIIIVETFLFEFYDYLHNRLGVEWRAWLNDFLLSNYFENRSYFDLKMEGKLDNSDQQIFEDVEIFVGSVVDM